MKIYKDLRNREINVYDRISLGLVGVLAAFAALTNMAVPVFVAGYISFGLLWLLSCVFKYPLCASYVKYKFGDDKEIMNELGTLLGLCFVTSI